jgi:hypothetical protein
VGILRTIAYVLLLGSVAVTRTSRGEPQQASSTASTAPEEPSDAESVRAEIGSLEAILPKVPDRGATLFLLAQQYAHIGELQKALTLLKACVAQDAGFVPDPEKLPSFRRLTANAEFRELLAGARRRYPPVHRAKVAFTVREKDLFPEGLGVDAASGLFYMGSMHRQKIVKFTLKGSVSDFVGQGVYDLSPVGGVHVDPADHSVWASTDAGEKQRPELLHFDAKGKLLERYASPGKMPHDLNDLVLRGTQEVFTTDTEGHHVYHFDRTLHAFTNVILWRPVFYPNGITLSGDGNLLFVADMLGVIRVDLRTNESADVDPGAHNTLAGIDGLYWNRGELIGVQYGTGEYRVMRWKLSADARKATTAETLEYGTRLVNDPTTGAILGDNFYFMANTGIYNLENDRVIDPAKMEPVYIAVVTLPGT